MVVQQRSSASPALNPRPTRGAVFITGVSTGIGKALALDLQAQGFLVFGSVRKAPDGNYLKQAGGIPVLMDITQPASIKRAIAFLKNHLKKLPLVGLVNNAGISICVPWEHVRTEDVRHQFEVNFFGAVQVTQHVLPLLRSSRGKIIMVSSTSGRFAAAMTGPYACSKFALEALVDSLRQELLYTGIDVVSIQPGPVQTPIWEKTSAWTQKHYPVLFKQGGFFNFPPMADKMGKTGVMPEQVARVVTRTLLAKHPPVRQIISRSSLWFLIQPLIPTRLLDWLVVRTLYGPKTQKSK